MPGEIATGDQLGLGAEFVALSKDDLSQKVPALLLPAAGFEENPDNPFQVKWSQYPVKASFAFANSDNTKFVYGYIVDLPELKDQSAFDASFIGEFFAKMRLTTYPPDVSKIKDITVGEKSVGVTAKYKIENTIWRLNVVVFRIGSVGAFTFTLFVEDAGSPVEIGKLAQLYADKITQSIAP